MAVGAASPVDGLVLGDADDESASPLVLHHPHVILQLLPRPHHPLHPRGLVGDGVTRDCVCAPVGDEEAFVSTCLYPLSLMTLYVFVEGKGRVSQREYDAKEEECERMERVRIGRVQHQRREEEREREKREERRSREEE